MVNIEQLYGHMEDLSFKHIDTALTEMINYGTTQNTNGGGMFQIVFY